MAAPNGNRFWEARSSHGRNPKFKSAEQLWDACCEYFAWNDDNPLWTSEIVKAPQVEVSETAIPDSKSKNKQTIKSKTTIPYSIVNLPKMRAMTISGLCIFLDISEQTWYNYREKKGFFDIVTRVEKIIYNQKFTGAAADLLNSNIIVRELGLADKAEVKTSVTSKVVIKGQKYAGKNLKNDSAD